jgi:putative ABC transport system permease protein
VSIVEGVRVALASIGANKLRSSLTMLGMIIGVAAVIALVAAGAGTQAEVAEQFESLGSNLLTISPRMPFLRGVAQGGLSALTGGGAQTLHLQDIEAIENLGTTVSLVAPTYTTSGQVVYGSHNTQSSVYGVTPEYRVVRDWAIAEGRFIEALDEATHAKVVVLGATVAEELFGNQVASPVGRMVKINRQNYQVVGVMKEKGAGAQDLDSSVWIPLSTAQKRFGGAGNRSVSSIIVQAKSAEVLDDAVAELTAILRASHGLAASQAADFTIQNPTQMVEMVQETAATFSVLLGSIASISLVVGGIGIMNIMLVSVTERTREIGIRKAVGARKRDILAQFLVEAVVLSVVGGVIGVVVGYGAAAVVTPLLGAARAVVTSESVLMALGVSVGVGLFFGIYPANRAASLSPIEALRYE